MEACCEHLVRGCWGREWPPKCEAGMAWPRTGGTPATRQRGALVHMQEIRMSGTIQGLPMKAKRVLCVVLMLMQAGCQSVYRVRCTSNPSPAGVLVGGEFVGETACTVSIPKDSEWIRDGRVELTFCLPDGREKVRTVDLRDREPSNPLAETAMLPLVLAGLGLVWLGHDEEEDDDTSLSDDDDEGGTELVLLGAGAIVAGGALYWLFGGDPDALGADHIHVHFDEPTETD